MKLAAFAGVAVGVALACCGGGTGSGATTGAGGLSTLSTTVSTVDFAASSTGSMATSTSSASASSSGAGGSLPTGTPYAYVGSSDGKIRVFTLDKTSGALTLVDTTDAGQNPSFLAFAPNKQALYAVDEGADSIQSFKIDPSTGKLTALNSVSSGGSGPAHVAVDPTGAFVFGVNYGGGSVSVIKANADGSLGALATTLATGANAHQLVLDPSHKFAFVPDKGIDDVAELTFDVATGALAKSSSLGFAPGSGPRHLAFHPTRPFAYVLTELSSQMVACSFDGSKGTLKSVQTLSTLPQGSSGPNTGAEVALSASGKHLYGSNRGDDSIVHYVVDDATGMMTLIGHTATGGSTPRHFSIEPAGEILLVANQGTANVVTFKVDANDGTLTKLATTPIPVSPAFVGVLYL